MQTALLLSVLAPALGAALLLVLGPGRGEVRSAKSLVALTFIAPLGAVAAYVPVRGFPGLPPSDASVWALWMGFVAAAEVIAERVLPPAGRWASRSIVALLTIFLIVRPLVGSIWPAMTSTLVLVGSMAVVVALWELLGRRAESMPGPAVPLAMAGLSAGTATVLGVSGTALLAQTAGGLAGAWGVVMLFALWRTELTSDSAVGPTVVVLSGLVVGGFNYADLGWWSVVFMAAAAFAVALVRLPAGIASGWRAAIGLGVVVALFSGAAIAASVVPQLTPETSEGEAESDGYDDDYGY